MSKTVPKSIVITVLILVLSFSFGYGQGDNSPDPNVNLGCLESAILTGSVPEGEGRGIPSDILWNPQTNSYLTESAWHEYGLAYDTTVAGITPDNPLYWQVEWPTAKNINYITCTGPFGNQPQPHTGWAVQIDVDGEWMNLAKADNGWPADTLKGVGGWVDDGLLWLRLQEPVVTTKLRFIAYANPDSLADGVTTSADSLWSFVFVGRQSQSTTNSCLIQYLDFSEAEATNRPNEDVNLALENEAVVSGRYDYNEIQNLRGHPTDMLWNPQTGDFHNPYSWWGEYGMPYDYDAGYVTYDEPFYWQVEWVVPRKINYFSWGGCYGNQPQPFTPWAFEYWEDGEWVELASGAGTDRDAGTWQYDSEDRQVDFWGMGVDSTTNSEWMSDEPIETTKIRLAVWSDGIDPLWSFHIRGRGGRTNNWDERDYVRNYQPVGYVSNTSETEAGLGGIFVNGEVGNAEPIPSTFKAILVQYRRPTAIETAGNVFTPTELALEQNYPNPFNPETSIEFTIRKSGQVTLDVFDIRGQHVTTLVNKTMQLGTHKVTFNANSLSSGVYYYRLNTENGVLTKKMMVIK